MIFGKPKTPLTPEQQLQRRQNIGVGLAALSESLRGGDPVGRTLGLQKQFEAQQQKAEQEELQEEFFTDPKYKNMAKIYGMEFAFQQREADSEAEMQAQKNQKFLNAVKDTVYEDIANVAGVDLARQSYAQKELTPKTVPADIQKLNQLATLREQLNPKSPSYNPNYTEKQFQQDASILGVSSNLFSGSKTDFITDYMKQMRTMKTTVGKPIYTDEQLKTMAESAYELIYPPTEEGEDLINVKDEKVINLGNLNNLQQ